ncbi:hypothetical protein DFH09DRAFT_1376205 [Mycena vulgaris]|nr:hypothetical protein DFH09DRAFT_1376205 [Mycena vulgaris]
MHASLRLNNVSKLPDPLQALAMAAASGSLNDLQALHRLIPDSPQSQLRLFIPSFYANLSPGQLPDPHEANLEDRISRATVALEGLSALHEHLISRASREVWSAVCDFVQFLDEYDHHHPDAAAASRGPTYLLFITTMFSLSNDAETADLINTTPRVRVFFTKGWAAALEGGKISDQLSGDICHFLLQRLQLGGPNIMAEVIEGAGGSLDHLAPIIVKHIRHFVPHRDYRMSNEDGFGVLAVFKLLENAGIREKPLNEALAAHGMVGCITTVLCALCGSPPIIITEQMIPLSFTVLVTSMAKFPSFPCVKEALDAGLLRGIVLSASRHMPILRIPLLHLLRDILPASLTYHSVLCSLSAALDEANLHTSPAFRTSPSFTVWTDFVALASQRLEVLKQHDSGALALRRACDNLECDAILMDDALRRCTACQSAFYCSQPCQAADWKAGHRKLCAFPGNAHHKDCPHLSAEDRAFVRALLHHDYEASRADILARQIQFARAQPQPGALGFVTFDYSAGALALAVGPANAGADFGARAARSDGRVELHVMVVSEGMGRKRGTVFPMRSSSAAVHEGVAAFAAAGGEVTPAMIGGLLGLEVVRTH